jgi:hypothetical protein
MSKRAGWFVQVLIAIAAIMLPAVSHAAKPVIAIIIDDMGDKLGRGKQAIALPGRVTLSFLPHTPHAKSLANKAHAAGKEVMLHLPMESETELPLGPGGLTLHMTEQEVQKTIQDDLASIPHAKGINNHTGSLLTRHPGAMQWLMQAIKRHGGLYFVDSRTTIHSVALQIALEHGLPATKRDVFLDHVKSRSAIKREFRDLLQLAKKRGYAVGIGHPYAETLRVLKQELPKLDSMGISLVPVSQIVSMQKGNG